MLLHVFVVPIVELFFLVCKAATFINENEDAMLDAITEGRIQDFDEIFNDYHGYINEKFFTVECDETEITLSPLESTIACCNPEMMLLII